MKIPEVCVCELSMRCPAGVWLACASEHVCDNKPHQILAHLHKSMYKSIWRTSQVTTMPLDSKYSVNSRVGHIPTKCIAVKSPSTTRRLYQNSFATVQLPRPVTRSHWHRSSHNDKPSTTASKHKNNSIICKSEVIAYRKLNKLFEK